MTGRRRDRCSGRAPVRRGVQHGLQDLHGCLLIHNSTTSPGAHATFSHPTVGHDRGHPFVDQPNRDRGNACRKKIGVGPSLAGRWPLDPGQLRRQTHDDLHSPTIPNNNCKLIKIALHSGIASQRRHRKSDPCIRIAGGDSHPYRAYVHTDAHARPAGHRAPPPLSPDDLPDLPDLPGKLAAVRIRDVRHVGSPVGCPTRCIVVTGVTGVTGVTVVTGVTGADPESLPKFILPLRHALPDVRHEILHRLREGTGHVRRGERGRRAGGPPNGDHADRRTKGDVEHPGHYALLLSGPGTPAPDVCSPGTPTPAVPARRAVRRDVRSALISAVTRDSMSARLRLAAARRTP